MFNLLEMWELMEKSNEAEVNQQLLHPNYYSLYHLGEDPYWFIPALTIWYQQGMTLPVLYHLVQKSVTLPVLSPCIFPSTPQNKIMSPSNKIHVWKTTLVLSLGYNRNMEGLIENYQNACREAGPNGGELNQPQVFIYCYDLIFS